MKNITSLLRPILILFLSVLSNFCFAESASEKPFVFDMKFITIIILLVFTIFILLVMVYVLHVLDILRRGFKGEDITLDKPLFQFVDSWKKKMTDAVPLEKEEEIAFDHEYDGIRELDNNLPPWWVYMFYLTIVFAVVYLGHYHVFKTGDLQDSEYKTEMAQAEKEQEAYMKLASNKIDENSVKVIADKKGLENGKSIFLQSCSPCHGKAGEGGVGPNLTDKYWIHGGNVKNIFKTIKYGVPQKGMISWQAQLNPGQMQDITSYILTLQGTNPANGKAPQGDLFEEPVAVK
jgi:cytochrome c oxidase cbb3-type subunit III